MEDDLWKYVADPGYQRYLFICLIYTTNTGIPIYLAPIYLSTTLAVHCLWFDKQWDWIFHGRWACDCL